MRRRSGWASARRSPPACRNVASTRSRRRCCGSGASTPPIRPRGSRTTTCRTSTACSRPSTGSWSTEVADLREFRLPDVGEGLTEGEVLSWYVAVGDTVTVNQVVVEVETAKAAVELPIPWAGVVTALHVEPGVTIPVGTALLTVDVTVLGETSSPLDVPPNSASVEPPV